jgi:AcrR family transcriptional regulator
VTRPYSLGQRQAAVDRTARSILDAAAELLSVRPSSEVSVAAIARKAGVSRITVYNRFASREGVIRALAPSTPATTPNVPDARDALRAHLEASCLWWAQNPGLYRHLAVDSGEAQARALAEQLAASDQLRPGCSLREAEDVVVTLGSFSVFDRLYKDGRRAPSAVAEILMRLAAAILV